MIKIQQEVINTMSLKEALIQIQQEKKEKDITERIEAMINEQNRLLNEGCVNNTIKVKKEWNDSILTEGGVSYYRLNDKWYKVSICDSDNDVVLKFKFKDAMNRLVSISAKSIKEAQDVVDEVYGKGKYTVSACRV